MILENICKYLRQNFFIYRLIIFLLTFFGYGAVILQRKAFSFVIPYLSDEFMTDDIGAIVSAQNMAYAISKFFLGVYSDTVDARWLFGIGLALSSISTICFSYCTMGSFYIGAQILNGIAQGGAWPATVKIITHWWPATLLGTFWSIISASSNLISTIAPLIIPFLLNVQSSNSWRHAIFIFGVTGLAFAIVFILGVRTDPQQLGFPPVRNVVKEKKDVQPLTKPRWSALLLDTVLMQLTFYYFVVFTIKTCVDNWTSLYLVRERQLDTSIVAYFVSSFEFGGVVSSIYSGALTDFMMKLSSNMPMKCSPRLLIVILYMIIATLAIQGIFSLHPDYLPLVAFFLGTSIYGNINIIGVCATEFAPSEISGSAHAVAALGGQVGGVLAGLPLSWLAQTISWFGVLRLMQAMAAASGVSLLFELNRPSKILPEKQE